MENPVLERLFKHMAWANEKLFLQLSELPEEALHFTAWNPEWSVGLIANHIVTGQRRFIARLEKQSPPGDAQYPFTKTGFKELAAESLRNDQRLIQFISEPDELLHFVRFGQEVEFRKSTVLAMGPHHATDHRSQIAAILAVNNMDVIDLDKLDLWTFEKEVG
jgi:uncharacterized damage-inducible protein DinB